MMEALLLLNDKLLGHMEAEEDLIMPLVLEEESPSPGGGRRVAAELGVEGVEAGGSEVEDTGGRDPPVTAVMSDELGIECIGVVGEERPESAV